MIPFKKIIIMLFFIISEKVFSAEEYPFLKDVQELINKVKYDKKPLLFSKQIEYFEYLQSKKELYLKELKEAIKNLKKENPSLTRLLSMNLSQEVLLRRSNYKKLIDFQKNLSLLEYYKSTVENLVIQDSILSKLVYEQDKYSLFNKIFFKLNPKDLTAYNKKINMMVHDFGLKTDTESKIISPYNVLNLYQDLLNFCDNQTKNHNTYLLNPRFHVMLIMKDGGIYRFFDPSIGIFKFTNKEDFAEFVSKFIYRNYNYENIAVPPANFEFYLNQDLILPEYHNGICFSLSLYVAAFFLENPNKDTINWKNLGLNQVNLIDSDVKTLKYFFSLGSLKLEKRSMNLYYPKLFTQAYGVTNPVTNKEFNLILIPIELNDKKFLSASVLKKKERKKDLQIP